MTNPTKFYYNEETASLYFLSNDSEVYANGKALMVVPQFQDGSFDMEEAYEVWTHDKSLGEEPVSGDKFDTLADVWAEAKKVLGK